MALRVFRQGVRGHVADLHPVIVGLEIIKLHPEVIKKINKVTGQTFSTSFTLFNSISFNLILICLTRIHRLLLNFAGCVFFQLHQCNSIPWNWGGEKIVIIDTFIQRTLHSETQSSHCATETNVIKILASSPKLPGSNYQLTVQREEHTGEEVSRERRKVRAARTAELLTGFHHTCHSKGHSTPPDPRGFLSGSVELSDLCNSPEIRLKTTFIILFQPLFL